MIIYYDEVVFQTTRPGLPTVRWKKVTIADDAVEDITDWSTEGVVEVAAGMYYVPVPIEDDDPTPIIIVMDTGETEPLVRAVKAVNFDPARLVTTKSGGGVLTARIGISQLNRSKFLEIIQGEEKDLTLIVEAEGRFDLESASEITVTLADPSGNKITKADEDITRVCEELDVQVIRLTLEEDETSILTSGLCIIEVSFDGQKAQLKQSLKIIESIAEQTS